MVRIQVAKRFWSKVQVGDNEECWLWLAHCDKDGYGEVRDESQKYRRAHQVAWELYYQQSWPKELQARHSCDNPCCVNPHHVIPVPVKQTHCVRGHPFTVENTIRRKDGTRTCRECRNQSAKQWHANRTEEQKETRREYQREYDRQRWARIAARK